MRAIACRRDRGSEPWCVARREFRISGRGIEARCVAECITQVPSVTTHKSLGQQKEVAPDRAGVGREPKAVENHLTGLTTVQLRREHTNMEQNNA